MRAEFFTKPLQGMIFYCLRDLIMNIAPESLYHSSHRSVLQDTGETGEGRIESNDNLADSIEKVKTSSGDDEQMHAVSMSNDVIKDGVLNTTQNQQRLINSKLIKPNHTNRLLLVRHGPVCIHQQFCCRRSTLLFCCCCFVVVLVLCCCSYVVVVVSVFLLLWLLLIVIGCRFVVDCCVVLSLICCWVVVLVVLLLWCDCCVVLQLCCCCPVVVVVLFWLWLWCGCCCRVIVDCCVVDERER